jgi:hypothetical protein
MSKEFYFFVFLMEIKLSFLVRLFESLPPPPHSCQILVYHKVFGGKSKKQKQGRMHDEKYTCSYFLP